MPVLPFAISVILLFSNLNVPDTQFASLSKEAQQKLIHNDIELKKLIPFVKPAKHRTSECPKPWDIVVFAVSNLVNQCCDPSENMLCQRDCYQDTPSHKVLVDAVQSAAHSFSAQCHTDSEKFRLAMTMVDVPEPLVALIVSGKFPLHFSFIPMK